MQTFIANNQEKSALNKIKSSSKLKISDIEKFYLNSMKKTNSFGLEFERLSLNSDDFKAAQYPVIAKIIEIFCENSNWEVIYDNKTIIGARNIDGTTITLEPGLQIEISLKPYENLTDIDLNLSKITSKLDKIAQLYNVIFLPYGINPSQTPDEIDLLNKRRYQIMNNYLPNCAKAELCTTMMRKTAGIQVNIDYSDKKDAYLKLKFFNLISPFVSGLVANSPINNGVLSEYKSSRVNVWLYTGENRCNLFYKNIFSNKFNKINNVFKNYIDCVLDVPMVFIERENETIPINGLITFREFIKQGFLDYTATIEDYILHQSLCFPDVRLKQYIEIRNHDGNSPKIALGLCALYKGLSKYNFEKLEKEFKYLKIENVAEYYKNAAKYGLDFKVEKNSDGWDVISKLFSLAKSKLDTKERFYLKPIEELIKSRKSPADRIIKAKIQTPDELIKFIYE